MSIESANRAGSVSFENIATNPGAAVQARHQPSPPAKRASQSQDVLIKFVTRTRSF